MPQDGHLEAMARKGLASPLRLEFFLKLRPLRAAVHTATKAELLRHWRPREDDVVVATPPKSGTTVLLQAQPCV